MTNIPEHVRCNHERTSERLYQACAILRAVEQMAEAARLPNSPETESLFALIAATQCKLVETCEAHDIEWAGHGGMADSLTLAEIAAARGQIEETSR